VKRQLFALLTSEPDDISLATLARAISYAPRDDAMRVWRSFVRSRGAESARCREDSDDYAAQPTQRLRIRVDIEAAELD
jgi:hypothetical protein